MLIQSSFVFAQISGQDWVDEQNVRTNTENELNNFLLGNNSGLLFGYLTGLRDANRVLKNVLEKGGLKLVEHPTNGLGYALYYIDEKHLICLPKEVTSKQLKKVVDRYLEDNPSKWHKSLYPLFRQAIQDAELNKCDMSDYSDSKLRENEFLKTQ